MRLQNRVQSMQEQKIEVPEQFVVCPGMTFFVLGLILIFLCGGAAVHSYMTQPLEESSKMLLAGGVCVLAGIMTLLKFRNHHLEVDGENLRFTNMVGRKNSFCAADIAYVTKDISKNPKLMGADGRLLASFDRNMQNFPQMILYLQEHKVPFK